MSRKKNPAPDTEPVRVRLNFERGQPKPISGLPPRLILSNEALSTLGLFPKSLQHEIIKLVASEKNGAKKIPNAKDTFAVKTDSGYGVIYTSQKDEKAILQVVTPSQLESFAVSVK